jgi:hypothetical protein
MRAGKARWPVKRDTALFLLGFGGLIYEAFLWEGPTRYEWVIVWAGCCGAPIPLRRDEGRRTADADDDSHADA